MRRLAAATSACPRSATQPIQAPSSPRPENPRILSRSLARDIGLKATDGSFPPRWFQATPTMKKEMLATALMAVTNKKRVTTYLTGTAANSTVNRLYIIS